MVHHLFRYHHPRSWWLGMILLGFCGSLALAQVSNNNINADVEYSANSQTDPHPTTYSWSGKNDPVIDPGPYYYTFFYTGTVNPDARVSKDTQITRVIITLNDWEANRSWIISKLMLYYQLTKNQTPSALGQLSGEAPSGPAVQGQGGTGQGAMNQGAMNQGGFNQGAQGMQSGPSLSGMPGGNSDTSLSGYTPNQSYFGAPTVGGTSGGMPGGPMSTGMMPGGSMPGGSMAGGMMPGGPMPGGPMSTGMMPGGMPRNSMMQRSGGNNPGQGGSANNGLDLRAMAEWTFYYDQLVLWQYYCARQLLKDMDGELLESQSPLNSSGANVGGGAMRGGAAGSGPGRGGASRGGAMMGRNATMGSSDLMAKKDFSPVELASATAPGEAGKETMDILKKQLNGNGSSSNSGASRMGSMGGSMGPMGGMGGPMGGMGGPMGGMGGSMGGMGGGMGRGMGRSVNSSSSGGGPGQARESFQPAEDYANPDRNLQYREKFQEAASKREQDLFHSFIEMINRIDERGINQERYDDWLESRRKDLSGFADSWNKAEEGDSFMMDNTLYMVTKEPADSVPLNGVNVVKGEQLTPQDLINEDGTMKKPQAD